MALLSPETEFHVGPGKAPSKISDVADELNVDLVAMSTHGRTGLERVLMGSVAENVIRRAPCPVFAVKPFGVSLAHEDDASSDTRKPVNEEAR